MNGETGQHNNHTIDGESEAGREGEAVSAQTMPDDPDPYRQDDFAYVDKDGTEHMPSASSTGDLRETQPVLEPVIPDVILTRKFFLLFGIYVVSTAVGFSYVGFGFNLLFYVQALRHEREGLVVSGIGQLRMMIVIYGLLLLTYFFLEYIVEPYVNNQMQDLLNQPLGDL